MSKSAGQRAYEAARASGIICGPPWSTRGDVTRCRWEAVAAAATKPELPSYGEVCALAQDSAFGKEWGVDKDSQWWWNQLSKESKASWEAAAQAVIAEARKRGDL